MTNITKAAQDAQNISNLRQLLIDAGRSISWQCFGECRAFDEFAPGPVRDPGAVIEDIRAALQDEAGEVADFQSRCMFVARLEKMQANGDAWLTIPAVLALLNDCDMLASTELAAQPAQVAPDDVVRYRTIRDGLVYIEPHESGEIYVAGETGVYTKSGDEFDAAIDAIAASQQKASE